MIINVAGAGAGKTTGLAKEIIEKHEQNSIIIRILTNQTSPALKNRNTTNHTIQPNTTIVPIGSSVFISSCSRRLSSLLPLNLYVHFFHSCVTRQVDDHH